jgi:hypothetical protein
MKPCFDEEVTRRLVKSYVSRLAGALKTGVSRAIKGRLESCCHSQGIASLNKSSVVQQAFPRRLIG